MLKKVRKWLIFVVLLAVYLNIGWGFGYYFYHNISTKTFESASWHAKLIGGYNTFFAKDEADIKVAREGGLLNLEFSFSIFWPFMLCVSIVSWIVHLAFWAFRFVFSWVVHLGFWIIKFVFWGGLFELVKTVFRIP